MRYDVYETNNEYNAGDLGTCSECDVIGAGDGLLGIAPSNHSPAVRGNTQQTSTKHEGAGWTKRRGRKPPSPPQTVTHESVCRGICRC